MKRRAVLGGLSALTVGGAARAQDAAIELKVSHFLPPNHTFQKELLAWGAVLERESAGRLKLRLYPAAQLGPPPRQFDLARNGVADIAIGLTGSTPGRYPMTELVSEAFVTPAGGDASAISSRRLTEMAPEFLENEYPGMRLLWAVVTLPLKVHTSRVPIRTVGDFKGLRLRYAGEQSAEIVRTLGAVPLAVPPGETQDGMAKGIIDGATFPYEGAQSFDIGTVAKYSLEPGFTSATFAAVMNPRRFAGLPADLQGLIARTTGPAMAGQVGAALDEAEAAGRAYMVAKGVVISTLSADALAEMKTLLAPLLQTRTESLEKAGKPARAFLARYAA